MKLRISPTKHALINNLIGLFVAKICLTLPTIPKKTH